MQPCLLQLSPSLYSDVMKPFPIEHLSTKRTRENFQTVLQVEGNHEIDGLGHRLAHMMVEVTDRPGAPTRLISIDTFYKDYDKLLQELKKHRILLTKMN